MTTTTAISSSNQNSNLNGAVTLTATVSGGTGGPISPVGAVTFMDGTAVLGAGPVVTASSTTSTVSYTTSALAAGVHPITAVFVGVNGYGSSSSSALPQTVTAPALTPTLSPSSVSVSRGSTATSTITLSPVGGYTGTVTLACGVLPVHLACSFSGTSFTFTAASTTQTSTLTLSTNNASAALRPFHLDGGAGIVIAGLPCLGLLALFRRRGVRGASVLCLALLLSGGLVAMSGCAGNSNTVVSGSYTVPVVVTAGSNSTTLNIALTVQ